MKSVTKDAANYLSKYLSKGQGSIEDYASEVGWDCVPRQWWNMTAATRQAIKRSTVSSQAMMRVLDGAVYDYWRSGREDGFKFIRPIEVRVTEMQSFVVGFWGKLSVSGLRDMQELAASVGA